MLNKKIEVLNLKTGLVHEIELPYTQAQEDKARARQQFTVDGSLYAGYCIKCNKQVLQRDSSVLINVGGLGNVSAEVFCGRCGK